LNVNIFGSVDKQYQEFQGDEDFDKKEFGFCKSMLHFK
jgi:hypothetical protein